MLWRAGEALGDAALKERATTLARAAMRRPRDEAGVGDATLCHGSAGLGLIHARWFNATGHEDFRDEAASWFRRAMEQRRPGEGVAGYAALNAPMRRWEPASGLLTGAAGVGLALLAAATPAPPVWDRAFLLSGPPAREARTGALDSP